MATSRTALQRERTKLYLRVLAVSAAFGALYGLRLGLDSGALLFHALTGVVNAMLIAGSISGIEIFLLREGAHARRLRNLPFVAVVAVKTLAYGAIITLVVVGSIRVIHAWLPDLASAPLGEHSALLIVGVSLATTLLFVVILQAAGLVGRRTFRNLILGRYRRPRAERRFFLFVDVVGSTAIAERLGALQAHRFLAAVFSATAEPVAACQGEIYQYVGDEIVITWTEDEGRPNAWPLRCFFMMQESLVNLKAKFHEQFAAEPALRAALHLGEVIAGEVGEVRRAIVFHGDVMNTASRLEQATRELGCRFIASADAVEALGPQEDMEMKDLGALVLRGRKEPIRAFAIEAR